MFIIGNWRWLIADRHPAASEFCAEHELDPARGAGTDCTCIDYVCDFSKTAAHRRTSGQAANTAGWTFKHRMIEQIVGRRAEVQRQSLTDLKALLQRAVHF